jgi:hypothetical protein
VFEEPNKTKVVSSACVLIDPFFYIAVLTLIYCPSQLAKNGELFDYIVAKKRLRVCTLLK